MRNLENKIPNAPNFKYKEFVRSETAIRFSMNNFPTNEEVWRNIERVAVNVLQPIRNKFGMIRITSGYRSPDVNIKIGGSANSNHCRGEAVDIEPLKKGISLLDILEWVYENIDYREMIAEYFPGGWIHIAFREGSNIKKLKLKDNHHHYANVSIDYIKLLYNDQNNSS